MATVYVILYETPNNDALREVIGIYTEHEEAHCVLGRCQTDNEQAHLYSIEEWEDTWIH